MFIYSVTIHINKAAEREWLAFMQSKHITDVLNAGYFTKAVMRKTVSNNEENAISYNIEYAVETAEKYKEYAQHAAPGLQKDVLDKFEGKFTAQRNFYEIIFEQ